jgi:hypothetical protein
MFLGRGWCLQPGACLGFVEKRAVYVMLNRTYPRYRYRTLQPAIDSYSANSLLDETQCLCRS